MDVGKARAERDFGSEKACALHGYVVLLCSICMKFGSREAWALVLCPVQVVVIAW